MRGVSLRCRFFKLKPNFEQFLYWIKLIVINNEFCVKISLLLHQILDPFNIMPDFVKIKLTIFMLVYIKGYIKVRYLIGNIWARM